MQKKGLDRGNQLIPPASLAVRQELSPSIAGPQISVISAPISAISGGHQTAIARDQINYHFYNSYGEEIRTIVTGAKSSQEEDKTSRIASTKEEIPILPKQSNGNRISPGSTSELTTEQVSDNSTNEPTNWETLIDQIVNHPEGPVDVCRDESTVDATSKSFIMYTGVDIAAKTLKKSIDVVFTLTPVPSDSNKQWPAIVWKTLHFEKKASTTRRVTWGSEVGFCVVEGKDQGTLEPGDLRIPINPGYAAVLKTEEEEYAFESVRIPYTNNDIAVLNITGSRREFALCTIDPDPMKPETNKFSPVVHLNPTSADRQHVTLTEPSDGVLPVFLFQTGPPVMLQAYAISNYQERKPIAGKLPKPLFTKSIDISKLRENTAFRLYSNYSGQVILEED